MKKILAILLVLCLVLGLSSAAMAAGAPKFKKQPAPTTETTSEKGKIVFTFDATDYDQNLSNWIFENPETGETYTGPELRELMSDVKGFSLKATNKKKYLTLEKVPESMNGWYVRVVLSNKNGYTVTSDDTRLWCYGMENAGSAADAGNTEPAPENNIPAVKYITVKAEDLKLFTLDAEGNPVDTEPAATLTFAESGNVSVQSDRPVEYWIVNGMKITPAQSVNGFVLMDVKTDLNISAVFGEAPADPNAPCQVTCTGCTFTYHAGQLRSVTSGAVPPGAAIIVSAAAGADVSAGYTINGEGPERAGSVSFRLVINGDTTISLP